MKSKFFWGFIICVFLTFSASAQNQSGNPSIRANASGRVIENIINIEDNYNIAQLIFDYNKEASLAESIFSGNDILYKIKSVPFTMTNIVFYSYNFDESIRNKEDMIIKMKNEYGDTWEVDLRASEHALVFNKEGEAGLKITPRLLVKKNQNSGTYRASYHIMIYH